jgi:hypothetical protein
VPPHLELPARAFVSIRDRIDHLSEKIDQLTTCYNHAAYMAVMDLTQEIKQLLDELDAPELRKILHIEIQKIQMVQMFYANAAYEKTAFLLFMIAFLIMPLQFTTNLGIHLFLNMCALACWAYCNYLHHNMLITAVMFAILTAACSFDPLNTRAILAVVCCVGGRIAYQMIKK